MVVRELYKLNCCLISKMQHILLRMHQRTTGLMKWESSEKFYNELQKQIDQMSHVMITGNLNANVKNILILNIAATENQIKLNKREQIKRLCRTQCVE